MSSQLHATKDDKWSNRPPCTMWFKPTATRIEDDGSEPIAIIGFSARLPQDGGSSEGFWKLVCEGRSTASRIPKERFNVDAFYHPDADRIDTMHVKSAHLLDGDIAAFDAPFFSIQPSEVASMDPQQRCMLEASFRAFENAGITMESAVASRTCVFVGNSARDYEALLLRDPESPARYIGTGIGTSMLANRISWFYDLRGPSVALDTACSSSLSALHLACQSLRNHESRMGLVGGCNLILAPDVSIIPLTNMGFFSPDGKCFSFDHRANGYAKGEGAGFIVIKRLTDALEDGDTIRAVIRATGANQDGKTPGLTQPSQKAQEENIRETYSRGGLNMNKTKYFESHGTGTQVGDPIEAGAINAAFRRTPENPLYVGAVKPNIGHLEAASSIAGLIKCVMVLEKGVIPPNINFEKPNINIPAEQWNIKFPLELTPFPSHGLRRASINSFGYGGSNTHAVLDDAFNYLRIRGINGYHNTVPLPPTQESLYQRYTESASPTKDTATLSDGPPPNHTEQWKVIVFSAMDEDGLERLATIYQDHFSTSFESQKYKSAMYLHNLAYTLSEKRSHLPWKSFVLAKSIIELQKGLFKRIAKPVRSSIGPMLGFVFTGQGAQWIGMGRELLLYPVFQRSLSRSQITLQDMGVAWKLEDMLRPDIEGSTIDSPEVAQPLCTALQIAIVDLLASWLIFPDAIIGHSSGEIAAAYCAESISHESAMRIAYYRGFLAARVEGRVPGQGTMISVGVSESAILPILSEINHNENYGHIEIGCINSPENVTVTGDRRGIDALSVIMQEKGIFERRLPVNVAYHSAFMTTIAEEYMELIRGIGAPTGKRFHDIRQPIIFSTVIGSMVPTESLSQPAYWVNNLVSKVKFSSALEDMARHLLKGRTTGKVRKIILIEVGPSSALQRPVKDTIGKISGSEDIAYESILKRNQPGTQSCLGLIGKLWASGCQLSLPKVNSPTANEAELRLLVNLPAYPFNHAHSHWTESRISKNFRMRKHARHDLLGNTLADWNPLEPRWRNVIRIKESPWIVDHAIQGSMLYPAAGMLIMAIEGVRQITNTDRAISGYRLTHVSIDKALVLSSAAEGVETQLHFRHRRDVSKNSLDGYDFTLYAYANEEWVIVCDGTVSLDFREPDIYACCPEVPSRRLSDIVQTVGAGTEACKEAVNSKQFYRNLNALGYNFGPTFQSLGRIRYNEKGEAVATLRLDRWRENVEDIIATDHVIHPTALDGILHLTLAVLSKGGWDTIATSVPTQAKSLWVSSDLLLQGKPSEVSIYTRRTFHGYRESDFWIAAVNSESRLMVLVEGWRMTTLSSIDSSISKQPDMSCYHIEWKPDPTLMSEAQIARYCENSVIKTGFLEAAQVDRLELVCLLFMSSILKRGSSTKILAPHLQKYLDWTELRFSHSKLNYWLAKDADGDSLKTESPCRDDVLESFAKSSAEGALHVTVGQSVERVLDGEVEALDLLFSTSLAPNFYHSSSFGVSYRKIAAYIDLLAHENPSLRVLEIGAGTGAATKPILRTLCSEDEIDGILRCSEYSYTDISPAFFQDAKERFGSYADRMTFATLNIEQDPSEQGFGIEGYDVVICALVLHATASLNNSLQNARKVLKPGGKLILFEPTNPEATRVSFVFGLLPGWWLGNEDIRQQGPLLSDADWHKVLLENDFSGADICMRDFQDERHTFSAIISTALDIKPEPAQNLSVTIAIGSSPSQRNIASQIEARLRSTTVISTETCGVAELLDMDLGSRICIVLLEIEKPFLTNMSEVDFAALKAMTSSADGIMWVTRGCAANPSRPESGLATGFGRNMNSEDMSKQFVEIAIEADTPVLQTVDLIVKAFNASFASGSAAKETEYMQKEDLLCLSRVVRDPQLSHSIAAKTQEQDFEMQSFGTDHGRALELSIRSPGQLNTLHFKDDENNSTPLAPDDVEIKVSATGLAHEDVTIALGQEPGNTFGLECAGIVTCVGSAVQRFKPGDRVCCCTGSGAFKTYVRAQAIATMRVPNRMAFSTAAAIPVAFSIAYYALIHWARLQEYESILIHSGTQAIGQAAIQIALRTKAEVFTTVNSAEEKRLLVEKYGLKEDHILSRTQRADKSTLMQKNDGVDIAFGSNRGEGQEEPCLKMKPFGRFIALGSATCLPHPASLTRNISFISLDLRSLLEEGGLMMKKTFEAVEELLEKGDITAPQPLRIHKVSEIENAFREVQDGKTLGKHVLEFDNGGDVQVLPSTLPTYAFNPNATYVISGGLGGLGRSIVRWMVERQARHFILLSRSGAKGEDAMNLIQEMRSRQVRIEAPPCDISVEDTVRITLQNLKEIMPPVKGCIQASMVLKDGLFDNMSLEDFNTALTPKVQGSWHLHKHLPKDMDFYVLLSSITGVTGSRGQRNYACGNTYQNALARHRVSQGQKCISLDLGSILSIGFAAEKDLSAALEKDGFQGIRKNEFFALLDYCCNPALPVLSPMASQIVTGLGGIEQMTAERLQEVYWTRKPLFSILRQGNVAKPVAAESSHNVNYGHLIKTAPSQDAVEAVVVQALTQRLAAGLSIPIEDIDVEKAIYSFGIDSLVALDVRNWFKKEIKADITIFDIMQSRNVLCLGRLAAEKSEYRDEATKSDDTVG